MLLRQEVRLYDGRRFLLIVNEDCDDTYDVFTIDRGMKAGTKVGSIFTRNDGLTWEASFILGEWRKVEDCVKRLFTWRQGWKKYRPDRTAPLIV